MSEPGLPTAPTVTPPAPFSGRRRAVSTSALVGVRLPSWAP